jgi:NAD(P)-dependent dehydrogenase (short-subunit alcohol dehydrogenase family)
MPTVLIAGASRGLGREFVNQYAADGWSVIATIRKPEDGRTLAELGRSVEIHLLDVTDRPRVTRLAQELSGRAIDVLVGNAGVMGKRGVGLEPQDYELWRQVFDVNVMGPAALAYAFLPHVAASQKRCMMFVTSQMGSITNTSGGSTIYRSSKAALNMVAKNLSIEFAPKNVTLAVIHPGWVRTDMGGAGAALSPEQSVSGMRRVIAGLTAHDTGKFFNHDGAALPW